MSETDPKVPALRAAATVILVRERQDRPQVYLLQRSAQSGFMGGKYVFPGGTLDESDRASGFWLRHVDLYGEAVTERLGGGMHEDDVLAYGVAAIRETLEESGVFLASRSSGLPTDYERVAALRLEENLSDDWFPDLIEAEDWQLRFSQLARWAQWITPERMKHRYDTRFFLAFMPSDQTCHPDDRETVHGIWVTPEEGLAGNLTGEIPLSPPTVVTLHQLMAYESFEDLLRHVETRQWGDALAPNMVITKAGPVILEPWDPEWHLDTISVDQAYLLDNIVPVGEPFSRIWLHENLWRPVRV